MNRSQYDEDVITFSPQGRIHQVEYAMEAVKQVCENYKKKGTLTIGLRSDTHAVLLALKRHSGDYSSHQEKILKVSEHIGVSISGLTSDGRTLVNEMRDMALYYDFAFSSPIQCSRMVADLTDEMQQATMGKKGRAYGVGMLLAGFDEHGPCIYNICPSANFYKCYAMAIGSRSQGAKTLLEKEFTMFKSVDLDSLLQTGLRIMKKCLPRDIELSSVNCSIAVVGAECPFTVLSTEEVKEKLEKLAAGLSEAQQAQAE